MKKSRFTASYIALDQLTPAGFARLCWVRKELGATKEQETLP